jgi:hypothetical protein
MIPYVCKSDMQPWRYFDPTVKKNRIFTSRDCATHLPLPLSAACVSFDLPPLPSMVGDYTDELHQLYFASHHSALVNSNDGFIFLENHMDWILSSTLFGFALLWPLLLLLLAAKGKSHRVDEVALGRDGGIRIRPVKTTIHRGHCCASPSAPVHRGGGGGQRFLDATANANETIFCVVDRNNFFLIARGERRRKGRSSGRGNVTASQNNETEGSVTRGNSTTSRRDKRPGGQCNEKTRRQHNKR